MILECSDCKTFVSVKESGGYKRHYGGHAPESKYTLCACEQCGAPLLIRQTNIGNYMEGDKWDRPFMIFPSTDIRVNSNAPVIVQSTFEEAVACYRAEAFTASAIMCRKTLEAICTGHGIKKKGLQALLKGMLDAGIIDTRLYEWSDLLRLVGNEAAHDQEVSVSREDARDMLEFSGAIMDYLYSFRDRFEAFKKRRDSVAKDNPQQPKAGG